MRVISILIICLLAASCSGTPKIITIPKAKADANLLHPCEVVGPLQGKKRSHIAPHHLRAVELSKLCAKRHEGLSKWVIEQDK